MPAIHTKALCNIIVSIASDYLVQAGVRCTEFGIVYLFHTRFVFLSGIKIIRAAEVVFSTSATNSRVFGITIHKEFNFAFAPPAIVVRTISYVSSYILSFTLYTIQDGK